MHRSRTLALVLLLALLAACGSGGSSSAGDGNGDDNGNGAEESQATEPTATPTPEDSGGDDGGSDDGSDDDGNGAASGDLEGLLADLTPPNSSQVQRTDADEIIFAIFESTDSPESLADFYEDAIADTGMEVFSTTTAGGTYSWLFAESEGSSFGGVVTVAPASDGGSGSGVSVQVSNAQ